MKRTTRSIITVLLIVAFLLTAGCTQAGRTGQDKLPETNLQIPAIQPVPPSPTTRDDMVAFVDEAVAYARAHGRKSALIEFSSRNGSFFRGDLYIYAYDFSGTTIAHPVNPEKIGINRYDERDAVGNYFIRDLQAMAANGSGFASYYYINPVHSNAIEQKLGYVRKVDDTWWLGSGIYAGKLEPAAPADSGTPDTTDEVKTFVRSAAVFARQSGKDAALSVFNNKTGPFVKGNVYVYALDYNGNVLALPFQPDLVGTNFMSMSDAAGQKFVQNEVDLVRGGGGFISFMYPNPAHNFALEPKVSYVEKVDDTYWIGAGIYIGDSARADERVVRFVNDAKAYAVKNGRVAALSAFNNRSGRFITGDLYIFAYDYNGTTLAYPYRPDLIGTNRIDATDPLGKHHIREMASTAGNGGGDVWYFSENPYRQNATDLKVSFVTDVDGSYFIGAGSYLAEGPVTVATTALPTGQNVSAH